MIHKVETGYIFFLTTEKNAIVCLYIDLIVGKKSTVNDIYYLTWMDVFEKSILYFNLDSEIILHGYDYLNK